MRRSTPDKLTAFALAILHVHIAAGIFQAAIFEFAVHVDAFIQNDVLILERLIFKSIHRFTQAVRGFEIFSLSLRRHRRRGNRRLGSGSTYYVEATIQVRWMQAAELEISISMSSVIA